MIQAGAWLPHGGKLKRTPFTPRYPDGNLSLTCGLSATFRSDLHIPPSQLPTPAQASGFSQVESASGAVATTLQQPLFKHVQRLNQIRRAVPALQSGQYSTAGIGGDMAFKRRYTSGGTDSFALVTVSGGATFTGVPNGAYRDAVTGDTRTVTDGTLTVAAPGKGNLRVYVLDGPGKIGVDGPYLK